MALVRLPRVALVLLAKETTVALVAFSHPPTPLVVAARVALALTLRVLLVVLAVCTGQTTTQMAPLAVSVSANGLVAGQAVGSLQSAVAAVQVPQAARLAQPTLVAVAAPIGILATAMEVDLVLW